jgi:hypothetical protein
MELSRDAARDARSIHRGLEAMQRVRLRDRWSGLPVVIHLWRQSEPGMHRLLPDRVAGWRKGRWIKRANRDPTDGRVAISLPIQRGAATRAEMKSNAIAAVGVALVNLPLTMEPYLLFRITGTEMESGAGASLARLAVAQINPIGFTRGNYSKRAAVALPDPFHRLLPTWFGRILTDPVGCRRAASSRRAGVEWIRKARLTARMRRGSLGVWPPDFPRAAMNVVTGRRDSHAWKMPCYPPA